MATTNNHTVVLLLLHFGKIALNVVVCGDGGKATPLTQGFDKLLLTDRDIDSTF
jgi:hypothetical protein